MRSALLAFPFPSPNSRAVAYVLVIDVIFQLAGGTRAPLQVQYENRINFMIIKKDPLVRA